MRSDRRVGALVRSRAKQHTITEFSDSSTRAPVVLKSLAALAAFEVMYHRFVLLCFEHVKGMGTDVEGPDEPGGSWKTSPEIGSLPRNSLPPGGPSSQILLPSAPHPGGPFFPLYPDFQHHFPVCPIPTLPVYMSRNPPPHHSPSSDSTSRPEQTVAASVTRLIRTW